MTKKNEARVVLAEILAEELGMNLNLSSGLLKAADRILVKLWIEGYIIKPHLETVDDD